MKSITVCVLAGLSLAPLCASAQQTTAGGNAADVKYCGELAKAYQSMYSAQEGMPVSDVVMLGQCDSNPKGTIVALRQKLADKKIDAPHEPGVAEQQPGSTR
ncbi:MAG: hypothetical protein JOY64_06865 [Alphaproteobacteria bacterium]|nr:hypothetical protein [Alphaproteobacteria bacterium]MBV8407333.1 hypothetical protein [Alphaproteobacteria bacterium]